MATFPRGFDIFFQFFSLFFKIIPKHGVTFCGQQKKCQKVGLFEKKSPKHGVKIWGQNPYKWGVDSGSKLHVPVII